MVFPKIPCWQQSIQASVSEGVKKRARVCVGARAKSQVLCCVCIYLGQVKGHFDNAVPANEG